VMKHLCPESAYINQRGGGRSRNDLFQKGRCPNATKEVKHSNRGDSGGEKGRAHTRGERIVRIWKESAETVLGDGRDVKKKERIVTSTWD